MRLNYNITIHFFSKNSSFYLKFRDNGELVGLIFTKTTNLKSSSYSITDLSEVYKKIVS